MKIVEQTSTVLKLQVIEVHPSCSALFVVTFFLIGLIFTLNFSYSFGCFYALILGIPIFYSLTMKSLTSCTFDKGSHRVYLKRQNVFKSEVRELMLDEIKGVEAIEDTDNDGDKSYRTSLVLRSGEQIPLTFTRSEAEKHKIVQSINQFLGVKS